MHEPRQHATDADLFTSLKRQQFRQVFQPSRIVLGVVPDDSKEYPNLITLCFNMHCSYKPPMMAFAVWRNAYTHRLLQGAKECVLAVPGEQLADAVMLCGTRSGADCNKWIAAGLSPHPSERVEVPGVRECIANIELVIEKRIESGDHQLVLARVLKYGVDQTNVQRPLLSVGPREQGYKVLVKKGIHRLAVVEAGAGEAVPRIGDGKRL